MVLPPATNAFIFLSNVIPTFVFTLFADDPFAGIAIYFVVNNFFFVAPFHNQDTDDQLLRVLLWFPLATLFAHVVAYLLVRLVNPPRPLIYFPDIASESRAPMFWLNIAVLILSSMMIMIHDFGLAYLPLTAIGWLLAALFVIGIGYVFARWLNVDDKLFTATLVLPEGSINRDINRKESKRIFRTLYLMAAAFLIGWGITWIVTISLTEPGQPLESIEGDAKTYAAFIGTIFGGIFAGAIGLTCRSRSRLTRDFRYLTITKRPYHVEVSGIDEQEERAEEAAGSLSDVFEF